MWHEEFFLYKIVVAGDTLRQELNSAICSLGALHSTNSRFDLIFFFWFSCTKLFGRAHLSQVILCIIIAALKKSNTKVASVLKAMVQDLNLCANPWIAKTCSVQLLHIAVSLSTFSFFLSFPCLSDI